MGRPIAINRVVKNILKRYLLEDRSFWRGTTIHKHHIPHFLLNDIARFWRTMAVDFAYKLRTGRVRVGRSEISSYECRASFYYVAGLVACFNCHLLFPEDDRSFIYGDEELCPEVIDIVNAIFSHKPLDNIALLGIDQTHLYPILTQFFGAYDSFLGMLRDEELRKHLENLAEGEGNRDTIFQEARAITHRFREATLNMLFDEKSGLGMLTRLYGVL